MTIRSFQHHHPNFRVTVVVDDRNPFAWHSYVEDCKKLYSPARIKTVSGMPETHSYANGWVRQQIAKLYLHNIIEDEQWFFTDGDILFLHPFDMNTIPYSVPEFTDLTLKQNQYVNHALGIPDAGIVIDDEQVCVSDPPFRVMKKSVMKQLRQHILDTHKIEPFRLHHMLDCSAMSEWELIENFKTKILGQDLVLESYAPYQLKNSNDLSMPRQFLTHYGTDADFGIEWFRSKGIPVDDDLWHNTLSKITR